ncbi:conserved exported hypothetical protein [Bosea sp. 62]|nr:conserved exported hypothetical protein [Bosea sp. 21B]CAD5295799.1 conserved exported hypothetical protein [Bosea sp. 46]CAD5298136.1 conserved exported hypothetical protein [Bosea sp. 7B]VVT60998.1 conserved exported hypothetical protein [Bosea sp. EC-HK365B]VXB33423.1 conserved exported hypothetical protein [Bosea sp. 127]VXB59914.1 conserved exported hypothetical protein [Bosea sp. 125]VXC77535.1 conserved exported hypothetical protein [Bosea sp. 29B]VXC89330.1 conserved exported hypo
MARIASLPATATAQSSAEPASAVRRLLAAAMLAATASFAMTCTAFTGPRSYGPSPITTSNAPPRRPAAHP